MARTPEIAGAGKSDSRSRRRAIARGLARRCPACGKGRLFAGYTKTAPACTACGLDISGHEADDAPPWLTIIIAGHLVIPAALASEKLFDPPIWLQYAIWAPVILIATFAILPLAKGALIGLQWACRMHGFEDRGDAGGARLAGARKALP